MPVLLPPEPVPHISSEDRNAALPFLTDEDILPLLRSAFQAKRGFGTSHPTSFGQIFIDLLTKKQPALLERTRRFANHAACNTLAAHLPGLSPTPQGGKEGGKEGGKVRTHDNWKRFLYIMQHEWAVVAPGEGIDYIASDEATTCHLVGIKERGGTGVVGLAHVDSPEAVADLSAMETAVEDKVRTVRGGGSAGGDTPVDLDIFIVGGYDGDSEAGLLTAAILRHFASESPRTYNLQLALVSSLNTHAQSSPWSPSLSSASALVAVPKCRSLAFVLASGSEGGRGESDEEGIHDPFNACTGVFTGDIPKELRGPRRTLRALRLWGWENRSLIQVQILKYQNLAELETEAELSTPQHYNLPTTNRPKDFPKEDSSLFSLSFATSFPSSSTAAAAAAAAAVGGGERGDQVLVSIAPFRFKRSKQIHALSLLSDDDLVRETSTSPAIERPSFVKDMRAVLSLISTATPEDFFGPSGTQALTVPLPRVDLHKVVEEGEEREDEDGRETGRAMP